MDRYNIDIQRLKQIPFLQGNTKIAVLTRAIHDILNSNNILDAIENLYCENTIISNGFISVLNILLNNLEKDIKNLNV
jgi:hypothetical protein